MSERSQPEPRFASVDALLDDARSQISRVTVAELDDAVADGFQLVDIRPAWQRAVEGEIAGSLIIERNHLEWRLHPASGSRVAEADAGTRWIVVCSEGYTSSLAAAALCSLGLEAVDLVGGIQAWTAAGRPTVAGPTPVGVIAADGSAADAGWAGPDGALRSAHASESD